MPPRWSLVKGTLQFRSDRFTAITVIFPWRIVSSGEFRVMADRSALFGVHFEPSSPFTTRRRVQRDGYCRWLTDNIDGHCSLYNNCRVERKDFLFELERRRESRVSLGSRVLSPRRDRGRRRKGWPCVKPLQRRAIEPFHFRFPSVRSVQ